MIIFMEKIFCSRDTVGAAIKALCGVYSSAACGLKMYFEAQKFVLGSKISNLSHNNIIMKRVSVDDFFFGGQMFLKLRFHDTVKKKMFNQLYFLYFNFY